MTTAKLVPHMSRGGTLPKIFGRHCVHIEFAIYGKAEELIPGYSGGFWDYFKLDNGGFFMAPLTRSERMRVVCAGNYFDGEMSREAAGIVCCLAAYSHESFRAGDGYRDQLAEHFHLLRAYALEHPETASIMSAID